MSTRSFRSCLCSTLALAILGFGLPLAAAAQPMMDSDPTFEAFKSRALTERGEKRSKLELGLDFLRHQVPQNDDDARGFAGKAKPAPDLSAAPWARTLEHHSRLRMIGSSVIVDAIVDRPQKAAEALAALGMTHVATAGGMVSGILPASSLDRAAQIAGLRLLRPAAGPVSHVGGITSGGDAALGADVARATFGIDGTGIRIGVLSNSFDWIASFFGDDSATRNGIASGDLPGPGNPNGYTTPVEIVQEHPDISFDEGRAMVEIVHDIAPGAELGYATAVISQASYAENIRRLADPAVFGADILVDDIVFKDEPYFQDGVIAQAVDEVAAADKAYFTAAGNNGGQSYESSFRPSAEAIIVSDGADLSKEYILHDFDPGPGVDYFQRVSLGGFGSMDVWLQWDDPFASNCPGCPGADTELDFLVFSAADANTLIFSQFAGNIGADPVENVLVSTNGPTPFRFYLAIGKWTGAEGPNPNPGRIKWIDFEGSPTTEIEGDPQSSTIFGHLNAAGAITVGAALYTTAGPGLTPEVQDYSSRGGTEILFATDGSPTFDLRLKPDLVGPDGVNTTFFGSRQDVENDGFRNFFGTSAAAPHIAAVAALMQEASVVDLSSDSIRSILQVTAIDMDDPATPGFDVGFDEVTGDGFVDAEAAVGFFAFP